MGWIRTLPDRNCSYSDSSWRSVPSRTARSLSMPFISDSSRITRIRNCPHFASREDTAVGSSRASRTAQPHAAGAARRTRRRKPPARYRVPGQPSLTQSVTVLPTRTVLMWAAEFPSACLQPPSRGTIFSRWLRMSRATSGSAYSLTVMPAVVCGTVTVILPLRIPSSFHHCLQRAR